MNTVVELYGKPLRVELTTAALRALDGRSSPLLAEIHLIFGCMVVKRVWFKPGDEVSVAPEELAQVRGNLAVAFRTVRYTKHCRIAHIDSGEEDPSEFPLVRDKRSFVPGWLRIDYRKGDWVGEYGYGRA